ncbi:hypothetical protein [Fluviispira sanaruensis]|uniref:DUF5723 domain-containing protein n=1 Tax=Fluviispira sanaruensis TaxID=2493639 RepID=A0A4P2VTD0_FLUSA|nr:hypothetical protein [Fluviispira sanaruensis]BBH52142.1 hypothetical protein JCM31447_05810 [Fluviispira sanaruensis]
MDGIIIFIKSRFNITILVIILFKTQVIYSQELQREYRSSRFLGRGDTGIADANGGDSIFYNPAAIAYANNILNEIVIISPQIEGTSNFISLYDSAQGNGNVASLLAANQNKVYSAAGQSLTGIIFKKVSLGVMDRINSNIYAGIDPTTGIPTANIYGANRAGVYFTLAHDFFDGHLLVGINGKYIQKREVNLSISALDVDSEISNNSLKTMITNSLNVGSGVGADIGLLLVLHKESSTQLGITVRNLGMQYRWTVPEGSKAPTSEPTVFDTGFKTTFGTKKSRVGIYADFRDISNTENTDIGKRIHLGAEYVLNNFFGIMTGLNQGYPTFGLFLNFKFIKIEGGMYTEEIGKITGSLPSERFFSRIVLGWLI